MVWVDLGYDYRTCGIYTVFWGVMEADVWFRRADACFFAVSKCMFPRLCTELHLRPEWLLMRCEDRLDPMYCPPIFVYFYTNY